MTKILIFTTAIEHTTFRRTAKMLQDEGAKVHIIGFTRNNFPENTEDLSVESLGLLSHGNYFTRMLRLLNLIGLLRKRALQYDVIYNFTLDTLIIARISLLFCRKKWVYQTQDIRSIFFGNSIKNKVARLVEKLFLANIDLVVVSSWDYYTGYFRKVHDIAIDKVHVVENKLIEGSISPFISDKVYNDRRITIGYFGVMRCRRSWEILKLLTQEYVNQFSLYLRGKPVAMPFLHDEIQNRPNVYYKGLYRSPDDLNELYNQVDIVWACYPYSTKNDGNWKFARTIRFYESLAFRRPVIVQKGTPQEREVVEYDIGLVIDMNNSDAVMRKLASVTQDDLVRWRNNIAKLDSSVYYYTDEYKQLLGKIESI